ncbi:RES family NAD+ phosphorylase [Duganella radicis]|uniref:RES domain-containing protein n=1 Tax=Duganella radicis TaxID=551988 RepID=A0A6L6PJN2_9BURK|nr:RES family NAD+ phosphorylase [Duganella radicis]MTV39162.1 RES domain-containing protein [Duganella radicis]
MSTVIWRIAATTPDHAADDLSGAGTKVTGGRWNSPGTAVVYCSENISLAVLETIAHLRAGALPYNRYLVRIKVPDDVWLQRQVLAPPPAGAMISAAIVKKWVYDPRLFQT